MRRRRCSAVAPYRRVILIPNYRVQICTTQHRHFYFAVRTLSETMLETEGTGLDSVACFHWLQMKYDYVDRPD